MYIYNPSIALPRMWPLAREMMKAATASKGLVMKINLVFLLLFLLASAILVLQPPSPYAENVSLYAENASPISSPKVEEDISEKPHGGKGIANEEIASFIERLHGDVRIALVNVGDDEEAKWRRLGRTTTMVEFDRVPENLQWKDLFPEWIDEEEENEGPSCPEIPMPDLSSISEVDAVVARLPCRQPEPGWARDVQRLQVHLVAANLAAKKAKRDGRGRVRLVLIGACRPMMELFRSDDLVRREGEWWLYEADVGKLEEKLALPVGSCKLALPLWQEGTNEEFNNLKLTAPVNPRRREAYATVLHSSNMYICGAIALAHSLLKTGSRRDLVLLHDRSIPRSKLAALAFAGWKLREIKRIRNPHAEKDAYNEYNYSKLRLWQLTDYHKVVFVDADVLVLRNIDFLFQLPQISAVGNDGVIFNSGVIVLEPSQRTFNVLMGRRKDVISYNGGDQGFLNEVFVWWHRLPRRVNFLKNFWSNSTAERSIKDHLFGAEPPELYAIHYLGLKPWLCYRDYDCNWNVEDQRVYASDVAHRRWWRMQDEIDKKLWKHCSLSSGRKVHLEEDRNKAKEIGYVDGHWRLRIQDKRRFE